MGNDDNRLQAKRIAKEIRRLNKAKLEPVKNTSFPIVGLLLGILDGVSQGRNLAVDGSVVLDITAKVCADSRIKMSEAICHGIAELVGTEREKSRSL